MAKKPTPKLTSVLLNCTLKPSGKKEKSSTERMLQLILKALQDNGVSGEILRIADYMIKPGVSSDEGPGDAWPKIRAQILAADILIVGTPIWLGQPSSVCKRVLERMDAFLDETDEQDRMISYGRVAGVAIVGNEDGAHHVSAELFQALNDVGFTLPASAVAYWVGQAMKKVNFVDIRLPSEVRDAIDGLATNVVHLAKLLKKQNYPAG